MNLDHRRFGGAGRVDLVVLAPHADTGDALLEAHPEVLDACIADPDLLRRYLAVERDAGSGELAVAVAEHVAAEGHRVVLLLPRLPRGIIDPGRLPARALRHVFRPDVMPRMLADLVEAHAGIVRETFRVTRALDPVRGLFVDLHTMAPRSPRSMVSRTEAVEEGPDAIARYVDAFVQADGDRRVVDLITRVDGAIVADVGLIESLGTTLAEADVPCRRDDPYCSGTHLVAGALMRERRGITVDVPKDWLADDRPFALDSVHVDAARIEQMARVIARGVCAALTGMRPEFATR